MYLAIPFCFPASAFDDTLALYNLFRYPRCHAVSLGILRLLKYVKKTVQIYIFLHIALALKPPLNDMTNFYQLSVNVYYSVCLQNFDFLCRRVDFEILGGPNTPFP